jgi:hypothetical protein
MRTIDQRNRKLSGVKQLQQSEGLPKHSHSRMRRHFLISRSSSAHRLFASSFPRSRTLLACFSLHRLSCHSFPVADHTRRTCWVRATLFGRDDAALPVTCQRSRALQREAASLTSLGSNRHNSCVFHQNRPQQAQRTHGVLYYPNCRSGASGVMRSSDPCVQKWRRRSKILDVHRSSLACAVTFSSAHNRTSTQRQLIRTHPQPPLSALPSWRASAAPLR